MESSLVHFMAETREVAKRCGFAATILELKEPGGHFVSVNVVRPVDKRIIFREHIPYEILNNAPDAITEFVSRSICHAHARLGGTARLLTLEVRHAHNFY